MNTGQRKGVELTAEQKAHHKKIREAFKDWHPGPEELVASGEAVRLGLAVVPPAPAELFQALREARLSAGLSLKDMAERTGMDKAALSKLENGKVFNPTLETLWRYAAAVGKRLAWQLEDVPDTRPRRGAKART
jgi:DNA-binding XRE family transcriptional regulator